jgi:membrane fusion protein, heavy metal efflux system
MTLSRSFPLIGGLLLTVFLAGCAGNAQTPANEDPASAKAGTDDGHGHAADSKEAQAEAAKAPADADEGVVQLTPEQIKASGLEVVAVGRGGGGSTRLSGRVEPSVGARASVASTVTGRVERVLVAPGTAVKQNQALAIVVSGEAAVFRANALAASAEAEAARLAYGRDKALVDQGVVARQELEASRARSLAAQAQAAAAQAQAAANGAPDASGRVRITSPVAGIVGNVQVTPGGVVAAGSAVADVADPAMNELVFTAPPALAAQVTPGMTLEVSVPGGSFTATVTGRRCAPAGRHRGDPRHAGGRFAAAGRFAGLGSGGHRRPGRFAQRARRCGTERRWQQRGVRRRRRRLQGAAGAGRAPCRRPHRDPRWADRQRSAPP